MNLNNSLNTDPLSPRAGQQTILCFGGNWQVVGGKHLEGGADGRTDDVRAGPSDINTYNFLLHLILVQFEPPDTVSPSPLRIISAILKMYTSITYLGQWLRALIVVV